jgi:hypothetical protein
MKVAIVNAAIGAGYVAGQARLRASIATHAKDVSFLGYTGFPCDGYDRSNHYNVKASAMEDAMRQGFDVLIWMDASCIVTKPIGTLVQRIKERGIYLASSGYSAGQTCTDRQLAAFGIDRDTAMSIPDAASGTVGIDLRSPIGADFLSQWIGAAKAGLFSGSRTHSVEDSADPRFLFGRQDQAIASLIAHKFGLPLDALGELTSYWPPSATSVVSYKGLLL